MKKTTRCFVLCGVLALSAMPVFATGGPGGTDPPPPQQGQSSGSSTTAGVVAAVLAYLGL